MQNGQPAPSEGFPEVADLLRRATPRVWATAAIAGLLVVCFAGSVLLGVDPVSPTTDQLIDAGGTFGPLIVEGQWWRLLTASLLHAGLLHLAFNLWVLWSGGRLIERVFGQTAFLTIYVLSAAGASLLSVSVHPLSVGVGASGAIFGIYGALLAFVLGHRGVLPRAFLLQQRSSLLKFLAYNLVFSLVDKRIDLSGHLGGLLTGLGAGWLLQRDLLHPSADRRRRMAGAVGLTLVVLLGAWAVRARVARLPDVRDELCHDAAFASGHDPGRMEAAVAECSRAVKTSSEPAYPRVQRAWLRWKQGNWREALHETDEILTDSPGYAPARGLRVAIFLGRGRVGEAERDCVQLDAAKDDNYRRNAACAETARLRGDAELALKRAKLVLQQSPHDDLALLVRAAVRHQQRDLQGAIGDLDEVVQRSPSDPMALNSRGRVRLAREDFAGARDDAEKALAASPEWAPALGTRCFALAGLGDLQAARRDCVASLRLSLDDPVDQGMIAFLDGNRDEAVRLWRNAGEAAPQEAVTLEPWIKKATGP